ncbi:MAG: hypothetical protein WCF18_04195 [Chthoniobacteraceae bacterium]
MNRTHLPLAVATATLFASLAGALAGQAVEGKKEVTPVVPISEDIVVHPITDPYWAEDSFNGNDVRLVYAHHNFLSDVLGGGRAHVYAAQLRLKITDWLQFVAYKDGYMDVETAGYNNEGWNDIAAGLKFIFLRNDNLHLYSAVGVGYEFASGDDQVFQDDDGFRFWWSINKGFDKLHLGATVNYFVATENGNDKLGDSDQLTWHLHADYELCKYFSPVIEVNGYHVTDQGIPVTPFSGSDVLNLGGNKNENTITGAVGIEVRPCNYVALRGAYETQLNDDHDLFGHRWTFSAVIKF